VWVFDTPKPKIKQSWVPLFNKSKPAYGKVYIDDGFVVYDIRYFSERNYNYIDSKMVYKDDVFRSIN
jgi:hypothetical protein